MEESRLAALHTWFDGYVRTYYDMDPEGLGNIMLKVEHTRQVCEVMELIARGEGLSPEEARLAGAVALLHDVGRFPQYRRWRTFRDSDSDNHGRLAVDVIRAEGALAGVPPAESLLIEEAVRFHNLRGLPDRMKSPTTLFLRLVRDADKLDIWRIFRDYFRQPEGERPSAATLGFPDLPGVSPACVARLAAGEVVGLDEIRCVNDFKLLLVSWVFDLNFFSSCRLLRERGHINAIAATIPLHGDTHAALERAIAEVDRRAESYRQQDGDKETR